MNIFLVRHGQAAAKWDELDDPELSALGRHQAETVARELTDQVDVDVQLISSPMLRARETALPLASSLDAHISIVGAFREIPTPVPLADRQDWLKKIARQRWDEQHEIVREWRESLLHQLSLIEKPTVVFTHFMVLNAIVGALSGQDRVVCFLPDNVSVTRLQSREGCMEVLELGRQLRTIVH